MSKKLNISRTIILGALLLMATLSNAQQSRVEAAYKFLQQGMLDSAQINIDLALLNPESEKDAQAWYIYGFVYKTIYNKNDKTNKQSTIRLEALKAFKKSMELDASPENKEENIKNIKYLATTLYNDAAESLDTIHYEIAVTNFEKFKQYYQLVDPSPANFKQKDVEFSLAIGSVYTKLFENNRKDQKFFKLAKTAYEKVLSLDANNVSANYNMAILYYNQAVDLINQSDYDLDIVALSDLQDNSINLFKKSLPFMEKAYALDPNRKETLIGLSGIYFSLNQKEKSNEFKQKSEQIGK
jgi:tetratricopeptide (TPR) repeat protein